MFSRLLAIVDFAQAVTSRASLTRSLHRSAKLLDVNHKRAGVPRQVVESFVSSADASSKEIIMPKSLLKERSREFWKFLLNLSKSDKDAKDLVDAIKGFRRGFTDSEGYHAIVITNPMPKVSVERSARNLHQGNINSSEGKLTKAAQIVKAQEQSLNLDLIQIIMHLCGFSIPNTVNSFTAYAPLFIADSESTQEYHQDGGTDHRRLSEKQDEEQDKLVDYFPKVPANSLFGIRRNPLLRVTTDFIAIEDVAEELIKLGESGRKALQILQSARFVAKFPDSKRLSAIPHPILKYENDVWNVLYPNGEVKVFKEDDSDESKEAQWAIEEFRNAIERAKENKAYLIELGCDANGKPNELVIFNNTRMLHRRRVEKQEGVSFLDKIFAGLGTLQPREAISLIAINNPSHNPQSFR